MSRSSRNYGIVLVTTASSEEAENIAAVLLAEKLAACVSILPIRSIYRWEGNIYKDAEWQLSIKTDLALFATIEMRIKQIHSYTTPEIIALSIIAGSSDYLDWIDENISISPDNKKPNHHS
jgi:periplasmic divalent cation tolerance protein